MLPINILLPTRNSRHLLPDHLRSARAWLDSAAEITVVDSLSNDGTIEFLQAELRHPRVRWLTHPPGLYQSWNHGIAHGGAEFTYISTIGDTITREGLAHLVETARRLACDVVISRPRFVAADGREARSPRWPIHELIADLGIGAPARVERFTMFFLACIHALGPDLNGVLGSSASNLYRTDVLQRLPFPFDYGRAGDVAWGLLEAFRFQIGVTPEICSTFLLHPNTSGETAASYRAASGRLAVAAERCLQTAVEGDPMIREACAAADLRELLHELADWRNSAFQLQVCRDSRLPWVLSWAAWRARNRARRHRHNVARLRHRFLAHRRAAPGSR